MAKLKIEVTVDKANVVKGKCTLPMSNADAEQSVGLAARATDFLNHQLEFAGSDVRFLPFDTKTGKRLKVTYTKATN